MKPLLLATSFALTVAISHVVHADAAISDCIDSDADGYCFNLPPEDCNDDAPQIHPGVVETCNALDDDCNGFVDDVIECATECVGLTPSGRQFSAESEINDDVIQLVWSGSWYGLFWNSPNALQFKKFTDRGSGPIVAYPRGDVLTQRVQLELGELGNSLVWTGNAFATTLRDGTNGAVTLFDPAGSPLGHPFSFDDSGHTKLAWSGKELGLAWKTADGGVVRFQRIGCEMRREARSHFLRAEPVW